MNGSDENAVALERRLSGLEYKSKTTDTSIDTLQKQVAGLIIARNWVLVISGVLGLFGITLGVVFRDVKKNVTKLRQDVGTLTGNVDALEQQTKSLQKRIDGLDKTFAEKLTELTESGKKILNGYAQELAKSLPPSVHFLKASEYQVVALHYGNLRPESQDDRITKMTRDGQVFECNTLPDQAKGAIVHVMLARRGTQTLQLVEGWETLKSSPGATFVAADANGNFSEAFRGYQANSFSHTASTWASGVVFCPFYEGKKFKYRVESGFYSGPPYTPAPAIPDPQVGCIATVVGWF